MFIYFSRTYSWPYNRKEREKQTFLNIKNGETISFNKKIFLRNLNSFLIFTIFAD